MCHKKYDNIQAAGSHIQKCTQHNSLSSSSSSSLDKDENNNEIVEQHQIDDDNNVDEINSEDIDDDTEYRNDIDNDLSDNANNHQINNLTIQQPLTVQIQTSLFKQQTCNELSKIKCPVCAKPYSSNHTMLRHKMSIHDKQIKYCCKICDRSFFRKDKLVTHISNHQDFDTYVCVFCECKLKSKQILKTHLKKDHSLNGDESNYNELILKCQLKETIDIDSNMVINYGGAAILPSTASPQKPVINTLSSSASSIVNDYPSVIENVSKQDAESNGTSGAAIAINGNEDTIGMIRNRKSLVYDILNTPFDNNNNNIDPL